LPKLAIIEISCVTVFYLCKYFNHICWKESFKSSWL